MELRPDLEQTLEFLRCWAPDGPWALTAIEPDTRKIETRTFAPTADGKCRQWLEHWSGKRNLYFHVNTVKGELNKKAQREDIESVDWLHIDVDPRVGEEIEEEQERALSMLRDPDWRGVPPPTVIVFSGGGYQGFWKLKEPIQIGGVLEKAEDAKRYNLQLETQFGGDNCHNIDRIMRLPGTINLPDKRKKAKGRKAKLAELVEFHDDRVYDLGEFTKADGVQSSDSGGFSDTSLVNLPSSGNIERFTIDELRERFPQVDDRVWVICVQGSHPDEGPKQGDSSRSEWLFDACCNLVRADVPDEVIYSVITDKEYDISHSVLDKGSSAEKYALRQINRAKEHAIDPELAEMNERYCVIENWAGKCRILEEVHDSVLNRSRLTSLSFPDVRNAHSNRKVQVGSDRAGNPILKPRGVWWLDHPKRRQYRSVVFAPRQEVQGVYNLWRGFAFKPVPGQNHEPYLEHIRDHICSGDEEHYTYILGWMARVVQHPDSAGQTALVLRGERGTGKGVFASAFGKLFGRHFIQVADPKHLVGSFNAHLQDAVVVFGDEAFYAGDKKHESVLKTLVTEQYLTVEKKGVDAEQAPNCTHVILASNSDWVVPAGAHERRFLVLDVSNARRQDSTYFGRILQTLEDGGYANLLHFLDTYDLTGFDVRAVPKTQALRDQQVETMDQFERLMFETAYSGEVPVPEHWAIKPGGRCWRADMLKYDERNGNLWPFLHSRWVHQYMWDEFMREGRGVMNQPTVAKRLGKLLGGEAAKRRVAGVDVYPLGTLAEFRERVLKLLGWESYDWPEAYWHQPDGAKSDVVKHDYHEQQSLI